VLQQNGNAITGDHKGEIYNGKLRGKVTANQVQMMSGMPVSGGGIGFNFKGTVQGNTMSGTVTMGEYGSATWNATRA
jgi:hypothetical protein